MTDSHFLPYGRQQIDDDDIAAVVAALRSDWLTTGPMVDRFEAAVSDFTGAGYGVAVSSGTAALHAVMHAIGIGPGDEVIVPAMTFAATANSVVFQGARPVFVDVDPDTLLIDPGRVEAAVTPGTKAIVAVDYAGQPCDYEALREIAARNRLFLVADACHALGAEYRGTRVGTLADLTVFSFHPVKHITTGEGGMVVTGNQDFAVRARRFRNHGINVDSRRRQAMDTWWYEQVELGFNYRLSDLQCALGVSQLEKLPRWLEQRRRLARKYGEALHGLAGVEPLREKDDCRHAWHLYVVRLDQGLDRQEVFSRLRQRGIGVNVHYIPVHLHPFYRDRFMTGPGLCPRAEEAYDHILTLPLHQGMTEDDVERVVGAVDEAVREGGRG